MSLLDIYKSRALLLSVFLALGVLGYSQDGTIPQAPTFTPVQTLPNSLQTKKVISNSPSLPNHYQSQGSELQPKENHSEPEKIYLKLHKKNYTLNASSAIPNKQESSITYVESILSEKEITGNNQTSSNHLPRMKKSSIQEKVFSSAYQEIVAMLEGKKPLDLKRAVFLTENAFFSGQLNYEDYLQAIKHDIHLINLKMAQDNVLFDNDGINYLAHRFISDTLSIRVGYGEIKRTVTTNPKSYDFEDPMGITDTRKMFVSKLMQEGNGQCKSIPLYFLILVEALGGQAYLSFSPSHSFIKCKNRQGRIYNLELTNGMLTSDSWIVGSGYVKSEAVKTGIYLDTLNTKQVIANCLVDLAKYYRWRFMKTAHQAGYDDFNKQCIDQALKYHPQNIHAILERSNYYSILLNYIAHRNGLKTEEDIKRNPEAKRIFDKRNTIYALIDGLGYEPMPEDVYSDWLNTLSEKQQQQKDRVLNLEFSNIQISD